MESNRKKIDGKVAFVGMPCWIEMVYKLRQKIPTFKKITFLLSLVCGHTPSMEYTSNFFKKQRINFELNKVLDMKYRGKG